MSEPVRKFMASDAFAYVDTYRRLVMNTPGDITASKERLREKMLEMNLVPPRLYAELRAHEHAFNFVTKQQDPGMVNLGEQGGDEAAGAAKAADARRELEEEISGLRKELRKAAQREQELEAETVMQRQEMGRLQRRVAQANNNAAVIGVFLGIIVLVLAGILLTR